MELVKPHLNPEEKVLYLIGKGLFKVTDLHAVTNKRVLYIWTTSGLDYEETYASPSEEGIKFTAGGFIAINKKPSGETKLKLSRHLAVTNQRILLLDVNFAKHQIRAVESLMLSDVTGVDVCFVSYLNKQKYAMQLILRSEQNPTYIVLPGPARMGDIENRFETFERIPRAICRIAGTTFAMPTISARPEERTGVECYVKTDLAFPEKCAQCGLENAELAYEHLKIDGPKSDAASLFGADTTGHYFGVTQVEFDIPYCQNCFKQATKGMRVVGFNGLRAVFEFTNSTYANDFMGVNARTENR